MSEEIDRLRAFAAEYQKITGEPAEPILRKIARLESESADQWREAKEFCDDYRGDKERFGIVTAYIDHLTAERDRLAARVAELEAEKRIVKNIDIVPLKPRDVSHKFAKLDDEPKLNKRRLAATMAKLLMDHGKGQVAGVLMQTFGSGEPYEIEGGKGDGEG